MTDPGGASERWKRAGIRTWTVIGMLILSRRRCGSSAGSAGPHRRSCWRS